MARKPTIPTVLFLLASATWLVHAQTTRSESAAGARTFERVLLLEAKGESSAGVAGDIDGDGDLDIVLAKGRHWPMLDVILRNDGKGGFTTEALAKSPTVPLGYPGRYRRRWRSRHRRQQRQPRREGHLQERRWGRCNRKSGTFGDPRWDTRYITVADVNRDNRPDILVANRGSSQMTRAPAKLCLNDGQGAFPVSPALPTESATTILARDFDGDGFVNLLVPHRDGGQSLIFWNDGRANFAKAAPFGPAHSTIRSAAQADGDGDGDARRRHRR